MWFLEALSARRGNSFSLLLLAYLIKSSNKLYGGNYWQCIFTYKVFTCMISIVNHIVNCPWNYACSILKYPIFSIGIIAEATLINFVKLMTFSIIKVYKIRIVTKAHHIKSFVIITYLIIELRSYFSTYETTRCFAH
jgi:hypothetical protein